ncbi:T9SS type A sorting domain-containing protein [Flavobacterium piscinae]|uniref:T9SS type A sorting domain-containing protein n=1 Tax=Flavobacterium piscinae TaxID=2506424 RepID=A0A4Q1KSN8_9FLAO|nr:S8 family serine peptidase [Flavobacterium piscinae]RXR33121.1 T9SS type A sorting domain-containing protein [Flavobacterium piscinae]
MNNKLLSTGVLLFFACYITVAQTTEKRAKIISNYDLNFLNELSQQLEIDYLENKRLAYEVAKEKNWPLKFRAEDGSMSELQGIDNNGNPIYYQTDNRGATRTINAHHINTAGSLGLNINGQNMIAGVWDGDAIRISHQEFQGRAINKDGVSFTNYNDNSDHGTHVAGTIIAAGININVKGAAFQGNAWGNDWNSDTSELASQAAEGLLVSNHSYGPNAEFLSAWQFGAYNFTSRIYDQIAFNAPYLQIVKSAGNDRTTPGYSGKGGYDLLTAASLSKNVLTVGAVEQVTNYTSPASVVMSNFSSYGPADDGRVKPDIVAKGVGVLSTSSFSNTATVTKDGTSMSSPSAASGVLLLQQYYDELNDNFMRAATVKGLVIHTAREAGLQPGPDSSFGWGLMDVRAAALVIQGNGETSIIEENVLNQGSSYSFDVISDGVNELVATISWTDPEGPIVNTGTVDIQTPVLVNDLDLRITKNEEVYFPWKLSATAYASPATLGDNSVDNVEKVQVANAAGTYTITVSHKGNLQGGLQNYSLIVSGIDESLSLVSNEKLNYSVYPNPVKDYLFVNFDNNNSEELELSLYDLNGRMIMSESHLASTGQKMINMQQLDLGVYFLVISTNGSVKTHKIIKN